MERVNVSEAGRDFANIVNRVHSEGISIEVEQDNFVIARITPVVPKSSLKVRDLNAFLQSLPTLEDDADAFAEDVRAIRRSFPAEADPWD
jgi:antitoxin (DNA-binding transcriptional repressor) of toxin-antitoxin stability system